MKPLYILTYDHGGYVLWGDKIRPQFASAREWLEKYPCYKVVNAKGQLASAFVFGGIEEQKRRLEAEGIEVKDGCVDLGKYGYTLF